MANSSFNLTNDANTATLNCSELTLGVEFLLLQPVGESGPKTMNSDPKDPSMNRIQILPISLGSPLMDEKFSIGTFCSNCQKAINILPKEIGSIALCGECHEIYF